MPAQAKSAGDYEKLYGLKLGDRVTFGRSGKKGVVAFLGEAEFSQGAWAGVALDKPGGKHKGTILRKTYFVCKDLHGIFIRPEKLTRLDEQSEDPSIYLPPPPITEVADVPFGGEAANNSSIGIGLGEVKLQEGQTMNHFGCPAVVKYVGPAAGGETVVGLELDAALGVSDGSYKGQKLFKCEGGHGVILPCPKDKKLRSKCLIPEGKTNIRKLNVDSSANNEKLLSMMGANKMSKEERANLIDLVVLTEAVTQERDAYASTLDSADKQQDLAEEKMKISILGGKLSEKTCNIDLTPFRRAPR